MDASRGDEAPFRMGIGLGLLGAWLLSFVPQFSPVVAWWSLVLAFSTAGVVGIVAGFYPAWRAAGLDPVEALRYE